MNEPDRNPGSERLADLPRLPRDEGGPVFADRGEPDDGSHYYEHWSAALERLVTAKQLTNRDELQVRKEAWADAYRHTPHGKPVELRNDV